MADYTRTVANVLASGTAQKATGVAGATIEAGQPLYADAADSNKLKLGDANSATAKVLAGVALHGALTGQPITYAWSDPTFTHGLTTVTVGQIIILSRNAGEWCPSADIASGDYPVVAMVPISATQAILKITEGTVAKT